MVSSESAEAKSRGDAKSWLDCTRDAGSNSPSGSSSSDVTTEYLERTDGRVLSEFVLAKAGFDKYMDNLEGFRGGISGVISGVVSGVIAGRSFMGCSCVCGKGPLPSCQRVGSDCIAAMSSGGSGMRGEYSRSARERVDWA